METKEVVKQMEQNQEQNVVQNTDVQNEINNLNEQMEDIGEAVALGTERSIPKRNYVFSSTKIRTSSGTIHAGVDISHINLKEVDSRLDGTLIQSLKNGVTSEGGLMEGTDVWIFVNGRNSFENCYLQLYSENGNYAKDFYLSKTIGAGQAYIYGTMCKSNGTVVEFGKSYYYDNYGGSYYEMEDSYIMSPVINPDNGDVTFYTNGLSITLTKEEYDDILMNCPHDYNYFYWNNHDVNNYNWGRWIHITINDASQRLTANGTISAGGTLGFDSSSSPIGNLQISGADNLTGFMFYAESKTFSGGRKGVYNIQVKYNLADGTSVNDVIESPNEPIPYYEGRKGFRVDYVDKQQSSGSVMLKFRTVDQLVNVGGTKSYKLYQIPYYHY